MLETRSADINALLRWLEIRAKHGIPFPGSLWSLNIDASKSALLDRLLEGKEPLPEPPPLSFSYPWYTLIEEGAGISHTVFELTAEWLVVNQYRWKILEKLGPTSWVVTYFTGKGENSASRWLCEQIPDAAFDGTFALKRI